MICLIIIDRQNEINIFRFFVYVFIFSRCGDFILQRVIRILISHKTQTLFTKNISILKINIEEFGISIAISILMNLFDIKTRKINRIVYFETLLIIFFVYAIINNFKYIKNSGSIFAANHEFLFIIEFL